MNNLNEFQAGMNNCTALIKERGIEYTTEFYLHKIHYMSTKATPPLVQSYWRGYYSILRERSPNIQAI